MLKPLTFVLAALLAPPAPPAPVPSPAAGEKPLRVIGTVRATTAFCRKMIETASTSIDVALGDDLKIAAISATLRKDDLDSNPLAKFRAVSDLRERYASLRAAAVSAERAIKQFKADAKAAPTEEQKKALLAFANALAGALSRQQKLADRIGGLIAFFDASTPLSDADQDAIRLNNAINQSNTQFVDNPWANPLNVQPGDPNNLPDTLSKTAQRAADEIDLRLGDIDKDEADAANRIDPAFGHC